MGTTAFNKPGSANEFYDSMNDFPATGAVGTIYVDKSTNKLYRWNYGIYSELAGTGPVPIIYGFHINSHESDPSDAVTYLADAYGKTPAHMDFTNDRFDYGSWENAFFMPRPCMLKFDGTVDYYLDPDDYTKKEDGVTDSDVANTAYEGNAMIEWGQNGKKIWYLIVPDADPTSASVFISDTQVNEDYKAWSFINNSGVLVDHFYTPIYDGRTVNRRLRSISGLATDSSSKDAREYNSAVKNYYNSCYNIEVFPDIVLINLLLTLMIKTLNVQAAIGSGTPGRYANFRNSGYGNTLGLFYGSANCDKIFGMESYWGNGGKYILGFMLVDNVYKYKLTNGTQDGSTQNYVLDTNNSYSGYLDGGSNSASTGYLKSIKFTKYAFFPYETGGSGTTYYADSLYYATSSGKYVCQHGGYHSTNIKDLGIWAVSFSYPINMSSNGYIASLSCKPAAT